MKVKRQKTNRRHMSVYTHSFGFREPFQVLVDGNFISVILRMRTDLTEALTRVLTGPSRPMTTYCVQNELRSLGWEFKDAVEACQSLERRRCQHSEPVPAAQCIAEIIGTDNQHNYCVATQDLSMRSALRKIAGTPLVYINKSVVILEPPSHATTEKIRLMEVAKTKPKTFEVSVLNKPEPEAPEAPIRKKKAKAPNPLSMKKRKPEQTPKAAKAKDGTANHAKSTVEVKSREEACNVQMTATEDGVSVAKKRPREEVEEPGLAATGEPGACSSDVADQETLPAAENGAAPVKKGRKRRKKAPSAPPATLSS
ncbi:hypothetical protein HKX48_009475 [Thoreauomyces humboldtii]|nr:hypothetical protein HKX48_009475 [Thoreauomyces humboldtii]